MGKVIQAYAVGYVLALLVLLVLISILYYMFSTGMLISQTGYAYSAITFKSLVPAQYYTLTAAGSGTGFVTTTSTSLQLPQGYKAYFYIGVINDSTALESVNWTIVSQGDMNLTVVINSLHVDRYYWGVTAGYGTQSTGTSTTSTSDSQEVVGAETNVSVANGKIYSSKVNKGTSLSISFNTTGSNSTAIIEYGGINESSTSFTPSLPLECSLLSSGNGASAVAAIEICTSMPSGSYSANLTANRSSAMAIVAYVFPSYQVKLDDVPSSGAITTNGRTNLNGSMIDVIGQGAINASAPSGYAFSGWSLSNSINASVSNLTNKNTYLSVYGNVTLVATYTSISQTTSTSTSTTSTSTSTTSTSTSTTTSTTSSTTTSTTSTSTSTTSTSTSTISTTTSITTTSVSTTSTPTTVGVVNFPIPKSTSTTSTTVSTTSTSSSVTTTVPIIPANITFAKISIYPYSGHPSYVLFNNSRLILKVESDSNSPSELGMAIQNITARIQPPAQHFEVSVLNITYSNESAATTILATMGYPCYINSAISPFYYSNDTWIGIANYSVNKQSCIVSFTLPKDIVVGLMSKSVVPTTTTSTIIYVPVHYSTRPALYFALLAAQY